MEWIHDIATALIVCLVFWFWKPWTGAYAGEKGKNLARKEDLDKILAEVRAVTITQKEIESKISGDLWREQTMRSEKKEAYGELIAALTKLQSALTSLIGFLQVGMTGCVPTALGDVARCQSEMIQRLPLARIFCSKTCKALLDSFFKTNGLDLDHPVTFERTQIAAHKVTSLITGIELTAQIDLGITQTGGSGR